MYKCGRCERFIPSIYKRCPICLNEDKKIKKIITRKEDNLEVESIELPTIMIPVTKLKIGIC